MTGYVIAYSAVLLVICGMISGVAVYIARKAARNRSTLTQTETLFRGEKAFVQFAAAMQGKAFLIVSQKDNRPVYVSPGAETFFGVPAETIRGDLYAIRGAVPQKSLSELRAKMAAWDRRAPVTQQFEYRGSGAGRRIARVTVEAGQFGGEAVFAASVEDITDTLKREAETHDRLEQMQLAGLTKMNYLSNMSHEIRTPMNGIIGMIELAKMDLGNEALVSEYLEKAESLSGYLLSLINDILDISKIESGKFLLEHNEMDLSAFARTVRRAPTA